MITKMIRAVVEAGRAVRVGRDDAKAAIAEPEFLKTMGLIEGLAPNSQELIAYAVERELMERLAEKCRKYLPVDCQQEKDYLLFTDSKGLRLLAEDYFSAARRLLSNVDGSPVGPAAVGAFELVGYYLLSRSWQDFNHDINIDAPGFGSGMIGFRVERRIGALLRKYGRTLPRSC